MNSQRGTPGTKEFVNFVRSCKNLGKNLVRSWKNLGKNLVRPCKFSGIFEPGQRGYKIKREVSTRVTKKNNDLRFSINLPRRRNFRINVQNLFMSLNRNYQLPECMMYSLSLP